MTKHIYMILDPLGRTFGVFNNVVTAKDALLEHSYCIIDRPEIREINCPNDNITIAAIFEDGKRVFSSESGGFTVERLTLNKLY